MQSRTVKLLIQQDDTLHSLLSSMTLHPALQNSCVNIRDECASHGTIWALFMISGCHGMPRSHVCVDMITFSFNRIILIGYVAGRIFAAADLLTRKCAVAPDSEKAHVTLFVFPLVKLQF